MAEGPGRRPTGRRPTGCWPSVKGWGCFGMRVVHPDPVVQHSGARPSRPRSGRLCPPRDTGAHYRPGAHTPHPPSPVANRRQCDESVQLLEKLSNDEWPFILQSLPLSDVGVLCTTSRCARSAIDSADVWCGLCGLKGWLFSSPTYVPFDASDARDRWRQQCRLFSRVESTRNARARQHTRGLKRLGSSSDVPKFAFYGCAALELTHLPEGVTTIGAFAFRACGALALTQLPEGVTTIEDATFCGCRALALTRLPAVSYTHLTLPTKA